ncbi:hypothetical protein BaRGS_00017308 [Batillaria attramentaria]|uniref:C2H2-type domain-containing protein n=1 Tax=Batillaria attramentaria TaxID=370345 RepID=A0ABD0KWH6_9CAEN
MKKNFSCNLLERQEFSAPTDEMQHPADDALASADCSSFDNAEEPDNTEDRPSSNTYKDSLGHHLQLGSDKTAEETQQESLSRNVGSRSASADEDVGTVTDHHYLSNSSIMSAITRCESGDVEQYLPETSSARDEEDSRPDDLPFMFQYPGSEDDTGKVYCCHICNFKTAFKNSLVNHQAVHSDARPWICEICDYAAKRKQDLKKHLQTMHGLIVDSLSLRPGMNPALSMVPQGLSGQLSPVETKPLIINNSAISPASGSAPVGAHSYSGSSTSSLSHHLHAVAGLIQPLPPSAQLKSIPRSSVPVVGKYIADKFPFNQMTSEASRAFSHSFQLDASHFRPGSKPDAAVTSFCDDAVRTHTHDNMPQRDSTHSHKLPSVSEVLPKEKLESPIRRDCSAVRASLVRPVEMVSREFTARSEAQTSTFVEQDTGNVRKRMSREDRSPDRGAPLVRAPRFQSPDLSTQVTSQSDHSTVVEPISSTVTHSRGLETKKSFHCPHCDILFFENALFLMHMGLHDNSNPWKCAICSRTFFEKYSFTSHFINQH